MTVPERFRESRLNIRSNFETRYRLRKNHLPFGGWLWCHLGTLLWLAPAHARIAIHVRGSTEFEGAVVTAVTDNDLQIQGRLKDELGAPIGNAKLQLSTIGQAHEVVGLTVLGSCSSETTATRANGARPSPVSASTTTTATDGTFCVRLSANALKPGSSVQLRYEGSEDYAGTQHVLAPVDPRLALSGQFEALPHNVSLDEALTPLTLSVTPSLERTLGEPPTIPMALALYEPSISPEARLLEKFATKLGASTTLTLRSAMLGSPGPAELVLSFDGNNQFRPLVLRKKILRTINVAIELLELPTAVTAGDTLRVNCHLNSRWGTVTSGSVELMVNGTLQSLLPVSKDGKTAFVITTPQPNQTKLTLELRYQPSQEGFVAGPAKIATLTLLPPSPFRFTGWIIAGLLVLGWFGWSRRRPPKVQEDTKPLVPQPARAHIEVLGPPSDANIGWEGSVVDAHESHPLGSVRIALVQQGFGRTNVLFEVHSDEAGTFCIPRSAVPQGTHCELVVDATAYATFTTELPPPGHVKLHLVSIRRAILDRLVAWSRRKGAPFRSKSDPTPDWIAQVARQRGNQEVERWAKAVSTAAFGISPPADAQSPELQPPSGPDAGRPLP